MQVRRGLPSLRGVDHLLSFPPAFPRRDECRGLRRLPRGNRHQRNKSKRHDRSCSRVVLDDFGECKFACDPPGPLRCPQPATHGRRDADQRTGQFMSPSQAGLAAPITLSLIEMPNIASICPPKRAVAEGKILAVNSSQNISYVFLQSPEKRLTEAVRYND